VERHVCSIRALERLDPSARSGLCHARRQSKSSLLHTGAAHSLPAPQHNTVQGIKRILYVTTISKVFNHSPVPLLISTSKAAHSRRHDCFPSQFGSYLLGRRLKGITSILHWNTPQTGTSQPFAENVTPLYPSRDEMKLFQRVRENSSLSCV
jgi:hypothetical protein